MSDKLFTDYKSLLLLEKTCRKQLNLSQSSVSNAPKQTSQITEVTQLFPSQVQASNPGKENESIAASGGTTKRTIEDLFGDLGDLAGDDDFEKSKQLSLL